MSLLLEAQFKSMSLLSSSSSSSSDAPQSAHRHLLPLPPDDPLSAEQPLRYFKVVINNESVGRFSGLKPKQAANKAFASILKARKKQDNDNDTNAEVKFELIECTKGSTHKKYKFTGQRTKLDNPVSIAVGDTAITYAYTNTIKKDTSA